MESIQKSCKEIRDTNLQIMGLLCKNLLGHRVNQELLAEINQLCDQVANATKAVESGAKNMDVSMDKMKKTLEVKQRTIDFLQPLYKKTEQELQQTRKKLKLSDERLSSSQEALTAIASDSSLFDEELMENESQESATGEIKKRSSAEEKDVSENCAQKTEDLQQKLQQTRKKLKLSNETYSCQEALTAIASDSGLFDEELVENESQESATGEIQKRSSAEEEDVCENHSQNLF